MIEQIKRCQHCHSTQDLMRSSKQINKDGQTVVYYICRACSNTRRKSYYYSGGKNKIIEANERCMDKKRQERYKEALKTIKKPIGWKNMNNHQKAKYIRDQRNFLKNVII